MRQDDRLQPNVLRTIENLYGLPRSERPWVHCGFPGSSSNPRASARNPALVPIQVSGPARFSISGTRTRRVTPDVPPPRFSRIGGQTLLLAAVPLAFLVLLLGLALVLQARNAAIAADSQRSTQILAEADRAMQLLNNAGPAIAAYGHSRRAADLAPYRAAQREVPASLDAVATMVRGDRLQTLRAQELRADFNEGLRILRQYMGFIETGNDTAARSLSESPQVRVLNTHLVQIATDFNDHERIATVDRLTAIHRQIQTYTFVLVGVCIAGIVVTLAIFLRFGLRMTRRILHLAENARRLADGDRIDSIEGDDEISYLDSVYQEMTRRMRREHDRSSALQRALLPEYLPAFPGLRLDAAYTPAVGGAEVGGDWYDVFHISERRVGISIGDVAGHGIKAAALMGNARQAIRTVAYIDDDPANVLSHVNQVLCRSDAAVLVTAFFATLDLLDGTLRYCLAGHPPPMLVRTGGSVEDLPGEGFVLGVDPQSTFKTLTIKLDIGSALVLYTDGVVEAGKDYFDGVEQLQRAIEEEYRDASRNIAEAIQARVFAAQSPRDDSALLFIGVTALGESALRTGLASWALDARIEKSARRVKRALLWHLGEIAGNLADLSQSEIIISELLGNVARHTPGPAEVTLEWKEGRAILRVYDRGPRFAPSAPTADAIDVLSESGRGIFLLRAMSREFSVEWLGSGNCVSVVLPIFAHAFGVVKLKSAAM